MLNLSDKTILVTGASGGIGKAIAIKCADQGANLIITGRNEEKLETTFKLLKGTNHNFHIANLNDDEAIKSITKDLPLLDGVVHCAGVNNKSPLKFLNREKVNDVLNPNFYAPVLLTQAMLKSKRINKNASLVMVSSISSSYATVSNAIYAASKGALESLIKVMALELAPQKIRVNGIRPGMVQTNLLEAYELKNELAEFEKSIPLGRFGSPDDIANLTVFLLAEEASWITGSLITIDGGITLR